MCQCTKCGISKVRVQRGLRAGTTKRVFVDETGRRWNARQCPDCKSESRLKNYHHNKGPDKRRTADVNLGSADVLYPPKLRACRTCKVMNPNYYECNDCLTVSTVHGGLDTDMYGLDTGSFRRTGRQPGFHY